MSWFDCAHHDTPPLPSLISPLLFFSVSIFSFAFFDRLCFCLRSLNIFFARADSFPRTCSSIFAISNLYAEIRFLLCSRCFCTVTSMPVAACRSCTALLVLLIFCPPLPLPRMKDSWISSGRTLSCIASARIGGGRETGNGMPSSYPFCRDVRIARLYDSMRSLERSHSGLVRTLGKRVDLKGSRGFESLPLRHSFLLSFLRAVIAWASFPLPVCE